MTEHHRPDEKSVALVLECDLDQPIERVWRALTVSEHVAAWLMPNDMRLDAKPDFTLDGTPHEGGPIRCEIVASEPLRRLSYTWRTSGSEDAGDPLDSLVTFELEPTRDGGTHLRIKHGGFIVPADQTVDRSVEAEEILVLLPLSAVARRRIRRQRPSIVSRRVLPTLMRLAA